MPTPAAIKNTGTIDFPMASINVKGKAVKLKGRIGGPAYYKGRLIGVGSYTGKRHSQQYFRMDYDKKHGHHGGNGADYWTDGDFHYHVEK